MHPGIAIAGGIVFLVALFASRRSKASSSTYDSSTTRPVELPPVRDELDLTDSPDIITHSPGVDAETQADIEEQLSAERTKLPTSFESPLSGVSDDAWSKYVNAQKRGKLNSVTPGYALGIWHMGMRLLQDIGMAKNVKLVPVGDKQVYKGDFVAPLTQDIFLRDASIQYEAFRRAAVRDANYLRSKFSDMLKAKDGKVTLSGLLAVARYAGLKGAELWLTQPSTRKEATTAEFNKFKGYF